VKARAKRNLRPSAHKLLRIPTWRRNLRLRPAKPALGNGRLQRQVRRAFLALGGPLSTSEILEWTYARKRMLGERISDGHRWSVRRVCYAMCVPVGRAATIGRPINWRLPEDSSD
jgi:hypothetical protein